MPKFRRVWKDTDPKDGKPGPWKPVWKRVVTVRPRYGVNGTVGPAVRFTWSEVESGDGTREPRSYTKRVVKQARLLNKLRKNIAAHYGAPVSKVYITVNSWYRSPQYNAQIGGAKHSQHVEARATDIVVHVGSKRLHPRTVAQLAEGVLAFRNGGIGWYDEAHGNFTHVDHREGEARWVNRG
jgi:hypothetical protein